MIQSADEPVEAFVRAMGWMASIRDSSIKVSEALLKELMEFSSRPAYWTIDAVGTIPVEDGEKWLVRFRTFVDGSIIWRMHERLDSVSSAPRFKFVRRSPELKWDDVGYLTEWPSRWTSDSNEPMQQLVEVAQRSDKRRK
ncbi:hypothetical protein [Bradyrhizobium archetypum]|uniref:Uncharacterized protein n=1 Tax=Bradyrhizobium archetypum TaxID=2721160 RepID=A0A7Y4GZP2_9BRAD|nr:hypothetical protein [Bradyrhizobium archetypum]NOJ44816.1 hypothetical protein [Bradyrhizobium archetypum]